MRYISEGMQQSSHSRMLLINTLAFKCVQYQKPQNIMKDMGSSSIRETVYNEKQVDVGVVGETH